MKINISDSYCEWEFVMSKNSTKYSIQDVVDLIINNSDMEVESTRLVRDSTPEEAVKIAKEKAGEG